MSLTPPTGLAFLTTIVTGPFVVFCLLLLPEFAITNPTTATTTAAAITPRRARCDIPYLHRLDGPAGPPWRAEPLRDGGEGRSPRAQPVHHAAIRARSAGQGRRD